MSFVFVDRCAVIKEFSFQNAFDSEYKAECHINEREPNEVWLCVLVALARLYAHFYMIAVWWYVSDCIINEVVFT